MKRFLFCAQLLCIAIAVATFSSCDPNKPNPVPGTGTDPDNSLTVDTTPIAFTADGDTKTIDVTSEPAWNVVSSEPTWLTAAKIDDTKFTITAQNNPGAPRNATVTISNGKVDDKVIQVTQDDRGQIALDPGSLEFGPDETGAKTVTVTSSIEWSLQSSHPEWLHFTKVDGTTFTVTVDANPDAQRDGKITVTNGKDTKELTVTQTGLPGERFVRASGYCYEYENYYGSSDFLVTFESYPADESGNPTGAGYKVVINFYSQPFGFSDPEVMADGTYQLDNSNAPMTFVQPYSSPVQYFGETEAENIKYVVTGGTVTTALAGDIYTVGFDLQLKEKGKEYEDTTPIVTLQGRYVGQIDV